MGQPNSIQTQRRPTQITKFFSHDEIRSLYQRYSALVPSRALVVHRDSFSAYCLWAQLCKSKDTAQVLFRAFDWQRRGYFDFEDFCMATGSLSRGSTDQVAEVLFRMFMPRERIELLQRQQRALNAVRARSSQPDHNQQENRQHAGDGAAAAAAASSPETAAESPTTSTTINFTPQQQDEYQHRINLAWQHLRYSDVVDALSALDATFLCLKCDGGVTAQSVAARLPFDENGNLPFEALQKLCEQKLS